MMEMQEFYRECTTEELKKFKYEILGWNRYPERVRNINVSRWGHWVKLIHIELQTRGIYHS